MYVSIFVTPNWIYVEENQAESRDEFPEFYLQINNNSCWDLDTSSLGTYVYNLCLHW